MKEKSISFAKKNWILLFLFFLSFFTYLPSFKNELLWDDEQFIYNNVYVKDFNVKKIFTTNTLAGAGEVSNYYRPLTTLSFAVDHLIWGLNPIGFHLTNTLLHSVAGIILFILLTKLGLHTKAAAFVAVLFLVHPLQTEAVVYANSRGDSYFTLLMLLGLLSFTYLLQRKKRVFHLYNLSYTMSSVSFGFLTLCLFIGSILAKEIAIGSILLYILIFWHISNSQKNVAKKAGLFTIGAVAVSLGIYGFLRATVFLFQENIHHFAGTAYGDSLLVRVLTFSKVFLHYIALISLPLQLHMERTTSIVTTPLSPYPWITLGLCSALFFLGIYEMHTKKTRWILFGFLWFVSMLLPISGIFPINDIMYEHWLYVPLIGFILMMYGIISWFFYTIKKPWPHTAHYLLGIVVSIFVILTIRQNYIWGKATRLYPYILQFSESARIHNNLGMAYAEEQNIEKAQYHYKEALKINSSYPQIHHNLARTYLTLGDSENAIKEFEAAVALNPHFLISYPTLIELYIETGNFEQAEKYLTILEEKSGSNYMVRQLKSLLKFAKR